MTYLDDSSSGHDISAISNVQFSVLAKLLHWRDDNARPNMDLLAYDDFVATRLGIELAITVTVVIRIHFSHDLNVRANHGFLSYMDVSWVADEASTFNGHIPTDANIIPVIASEWRVNG
jgi:hypothetical protein